MVFQGLCGFSQISRTSATVVMSFLLDFRQGFKKIMENCIANTRYLTERIAQVRTLIVLVRS